MNISSEKIPNNIGLVNDRRLKRALENWQPHFLDWWVEMGPAGFQEHHKVYLRTAVGVDAKGWAHFEHVRMPDYRWGIFLAEPERERQIGFGDFYGEPVWQEIPGEYRNPLRRLIVTQGDTEPASVEQQRLLGQTCPSIYDLRNLFQVNVEEGRHLWAMVHLLHSYFGRDGREEAESLLLRRSGSEDTPRILGAFNQPVTSWLDFFMFAMFTDRDGKYQLLALAESSFDPLSRCTRFMLTEEAHHMFVGETGVQRVVERTAQLMRENKGLSEDVRKMGGIDLPTIQKHLNLWYSLSLDLFGGEVSSNAATYFANGLKGRAYESKYEEHQASEGVYNMEVFDNGRRTTEEVPMRNAMNEILRDAYSQDCQRGCDRWNKVLADYGLSDRLFLPHKRFHRHIGIYSGRHFDPHGESITDEEWEKRKGDWLPTEEDYAHEHNLMNEAIYDPDKMSNWIAPPKRGINGMPPNYDYVRTEE